ncbi:MAG: TatD family hydrolase [Actinomycetota bacterium]
MLIDTHCHLDMLEDADRALERARKAGVAAVITIGVDLPSSEDAVRRAKADDRIFATVGLHPHDARLQDDALWARFDELLQDPRVVGVGEAGLDYHYDNSPREIQREVFARQIALAHTTARTLVIHTREAWPDTFGLLEAAPKLPERVVYHCFSGGPDEAQRAIEMGAWLSFSGVVTFKSADGLRAAAALAPPERILVETDAPFLTPVPLRGKRNEPAFVTHTAALLAEVKGLSVEEFEALTSRNALEAFNLPPDMPDFVSALAAG